jgi:hypothetical protein
MDPISKNDGMTPDHIPSGAAVVAACYLSDNNNDQAKLDAVTRFTDLYEAANSPYRHVYLKANTIVYDTAIHQKASPTYGVKNSKDNSIKIRTDAKNLAKAFTDDKTVVVKALLGQALDSQGNPIPSQKTRDANNKPTTTPVTAVQVEKAFKALDDANISSGIYTAQGLKTFCKK